MTATASLTDVEIARQYDVTRAVLDFESSNGLTLADFQEITNLPSLRHRGANLNDLTMIEEVGPTTLRGKPVSTAADLWALYIPARMEAFRYFSEKRLNLRIEDIILIDGFFIKKLIKRNLMIRPKPVRIQCNWHAGILAPKLSTWMLTELIAMIYAPFEEPFIQLFVERKPGNERASLIEMVRFVEGKGKKRLAKKLYAHLDSRLRESFIPEIDVRHYGTLGPSVYELYDEDDNDENHLTAMRAVGIPDEVSTFASGAKRTFSELNDDVKNGCEPVGETLLTILGRSVGK